MITLLLLLCLYMKGEVPPSLEPLSQGLSWLADRCQDIDWQMVVEVFLRVGVKIALARWSLKVVNPPPLKRKEEPHSLKKEVGNNKDTFKKLVIEIAYETILNVIDEFLNFF
ncbi:hypothetical protein ACS6XX_05105 [Streptococcus suis]|uniref:hypothetical protein n=2 Tax=Streptococcus suis TaxID=1307 RepID=UPI000C18CEFE|nr:hypothetical protein [Streptococcus suis]